MRCRPITPPTPSMTPSFTMSLAPPIPSSAGWKINFTLPVNSARRLLKRAATASAIVDLVHFVDGQRIHIGADGDGFRSCLAGAPAQQADDACFCDTSLHLQSQAVQALCHNTGGAYLLEREFGVLMQVATYGNHVGDEFIDVGFQLVRG